MKNNNKKGSKRTRVNVPQPAKRTLQLNKNIDMDKIEVSVKLTTPFDKIQIIKEYMEFCINEINIQPETIYALNAYEQHLLKKDKKR